MVQRRVQLLHGKCVMDIHNRLMLQRNKGKLNPNAPL